MIAVLENHGLLRLFSISAIDWAASSAAASSLPSLVATTLRSFGVFVHLGGFCHLLHPSGQPGKQLVFLVSPDLGSQYVCRFFPALQPAFLTLRRAIVVFRNKKKKKLNAAEHTNAITI